MVLQNNSLTRSKSDFTVELTKTSFSGTFLTFEEVKGSNMLILANTDSYFSIIDSDLNEVKSYSMALVIPTITAFCKMDSTIEVGLGGDDNDTKGAIFQFDEICSSHCATCNGLPKNSPSLSHGCLTCTPPRVFKGTGTCEYECTGVNEVPNEANDGCFACENCCLGNKSCGYDYSGDEPTLKCNSEVVNTATFWTTYSCIPPSLADSTLTEIDYEVVFNRNSFIAFITFDAEPFSFTLKDNLQINYKLYQEGTGTRSGEEV